MSNAINMGIDMGVEDDFLGLSDLNDDENEESFFEEVEEGKESSFEINEVVAPSAPAEVYDVKDSEELIDLPSIFDMPHAKNIKFFDEIKEDLKSADGEVSFDLDNEDPVYAANKLKGVYESVLTKSEICQYLQKTDFNDVDILDLLKKQDGAENDERHLTVKEAVKKLIFNSSFKDNEDFLRKLHKLREINDLINDSLLVRDYDKKVVEFKKTLELVMMEYEKSIEGVVYKEIARVKKQALPAPVQAHKISVSPEEKRAAELEIEQLTSRISEFEELVLDLSEKNNSMLDAFRVFEFVDEDDSIEIIVEKIFASLENQVVAVDSSVLENELSVQTQKAAEAALENEQLKKDIESLDFDNGELKASVAQLEEELKMLKEKEETLENKAPAEPVKETEDAEEFDEEDEDEEPAAKSNKLKIVLWIAGGLFTFVILFLLVGSMLIDDEPEPLKTTYALKETAEITPAQVQTQPEAAKPVEVKAAAEITGPEVSPAPVVHPQPEVGAPEVVYDFEKEITTEEMRGLKYDIYMDNFKKIRVNGVDFNKGDTINGHKFIKATSAGKILFISKSNEPVWVEMK